MYKVVIETWVEPEWECSDGCCWNPAEQRWRVVESDIPWNNLFGYPLYYREWADEGYLFSDLLAGKTGREVLDKVFQESEEPEVKFKKMLAELGVEVEIVDLDEGEHETQ